MFVLDKLLPTGWRHVNRRISRTGHATWSKSDLCPGPRYPWPHDQAVIQGFIVRKIVHAGHRRGTAPTRLFRRVCIVCSLQIRVIHPATSAEHIRHSFHNTCLAATCEQQTLLVSLTVSDRMCFLLLFLFFFFALFSFDHKFYIEM